MAKSDSLFLLIKAMTKAEKRHFKLSMSKYQSSESKDYLRLFDAIDAQKEFDENAIRKKFHDEPYFRHLRNVKIYLHKQILKSLKTLYDEDSCDMNMNNFLAEIEILYKKELFRDCVSTIKKAKAYAEKYERFPHLLKLIEWEIHIADYTHEQVDWLKKDAIDKVRSIMNTYNEITEIKQVYLESRNLVNILGAARTPEDMATYEKIVQHPLMDKKLQSFQAEKIRLVTKALYSQFRKDVDGIQKEIKDIMELYDSNLHQIDESLNVYFYCLVALAITTIMAKKFTSTERLLQKMNDIYQKKHDKLDFLNKMKLMYIKAVLHLHKGEFSKALDFIPGINNLIELNYKELDIIEELSMYNLCIEVFFKNKDFKNAQKYVQKIINVDSPIRLDMQASARIVNLILQYEQQEYEHLGYALRSTYRYLMKKQRLYEPELIIIDFLKKAPKISSEKQMLLALAEFREQVAPYMDDPHIIDFPLMDWIDSKLQKRELADITRQSYLNAVAVEGAELVKVT